MVRCTDCGFLAVRHKETRILCEVEVEIREKGRWPVAPGTGNAYALYEASPVCFVRAAQLSEELEGGGTEPFHKVIRRERECQAFTAWEQGVSPREHKEMLDGKEMREWQERRLQDDRALQEKRLQDDRALQEKRRAEDRAFQKKWQIKMVLLGACLTAAGAAVISWLK